MNRRTNALVAALLSVVACSVLNSPEDLKPVADGSGAQTSGGNSSTSGSKNGGSSGSESVQAGMGTGGGDDIIGAGGCAPNCTGEGGAPPIGRDCTTSSVDCGSTAPICDDSAGTCRACMTDPECLSEVAKPYCVKAGVGAGRCGECRTNADCAGKTPVCNSLNTCHACNSDDDCESGVCETTGACGGPTTTDSQSSSELQA